MSHFAHLLPLEHVGVEVLLQLLIGQVDAKLLKVVLLEALETCAQSGLSASPLAHENQSTVLGGYHKNQQ